MARIRWYDTEAGWAEREHSVCPGEKPKKHNDKGEPLYSWGQVVPASYAQSCKDGFEDEPDKLV